MATASTSKQPSRSRSNSRHNQSNSKSSSNHNKATSSAGSAEVVKKRRSGSLRDTRDPSYSTSESGDNILDSENEYEAIEILEESRTEYLIRWAGVDPETNEPWEPSWQPKRNASEALVKTWIDSKKRRKTRSSIEKRRPSGVLSRSSTPKRKRIRIEDSFEQPSNSHKPRSRQRKRIRDVTSGSDDEEVLQTQDKISNINNNEVTPIPDTNLPIFLFQSPHSKGTQSRVDPLHLRSPSVFDSGDANDHTVPTLQSSSNVGPIPSPSPLSNVHLANNSTQSQALSISKTGISKSRSSKDPRQTPLANTTVQVSATSHEPLLNKPPERNISGTRFSHSGGPETAVKSRTPLPLSRESSNHKLPTSRGFSRPRANPPVIDIKPRSDGVHKRDLEFRKNLQQSHLLRDVAEPAEFQLGSSSSLFRAEDPWDTSLTLAPNTSDNVAKSDVVKKPIQEPALSPFVSRFLDVSPQKKTTPQRSSYTSVDQSSQPTDEVAQMIATFNDYTQTSSRISLQRFISTCDIDPVDRKMLVTYLDNPKAFLSHPKNGIQEAQCAYGGKDYVGFELQQEANGSICIWIELDEPDNPKTTVRWENERSLEKLSISLVSYHNPVAEGGSFLSPRPGRKRTPVPVGSQPFDCTPESQHIFKDNVLDAKNALIASEKLTVTASVSVEDMGSPHSLLIASEKDTQQELVPRTGLSEDSHRLSIDSDFLFTIDEYTGAPTNDRPGAIPQILIASPAEPVQPGITTLQSPIPDPHDTLTPDSRHSSPSQRPWPNSSGHIPSNPSIIVPGVDDVSSVKNHDAPSHTHPVVQEQQEGPVPSSIVDSTHESSRANDADRRVGPEDDEGSRATTVEESRPREHSSVSTVSISESDSPEKLKKISTNSEHLSSFYAPSWAAHWTLTLGLKQLKMFLSPTA
ncbi:hypothetical protein DFH28DRAFT_221867 [Melampsora americana]|nr:hypothetical protein DFH28DRAFT_221867 [Melampsora americana]